MAQFIDDELNAHVADLTDELVATGVSFDLAQQQARSQFGDRAMVTQELKQLHPWLSWRTHWIGLTLFVVSAVPLYIISISLAEQSFGLYAQIGLVWWWGLAAIVTLLVLLRCITSIIPAISRTWLVVSTGLGYTIAVCITAILDINNFETAVCNSAVVLITTLALWFAWPHLSIRAGQLSVIAIDTLMVWFAWQEHAWFEKTIFPHCLYLAKNGLVITTFGHCTQLSWSHPLLWLLYGTLALATGTLLYFLSKLWRHRSTSLTKKILTTCAIGLLPILPLKFTGVDSQNGVKVIVWKVTIDETYIAILGRHPQPKDYDFYASTGAYQHLSQVRAVLFASQERLIKINLLFEHILHRSATAEELTDYAHNYDSIAKIKKQLKRLK